MPAEPSILVAPASRAGSLCSPRAAICFPTLVLCWPCCYLRFGVLLQTALPEGPPPEARGCHQEWVAGAQACGAGGCLRSPPSVSGLLRAAVAAAPGHPDSHTSLVCLSPLTCCRWSHDGCRPLALPVHGSGSRRRVLGPTSPLSSVGRQSGLLPPPCPFRGVPT